MSENNKERNEFFRKYFVLSPLKDDTYGKASREAMITYARVIKTEDPKFSTEISNWIDYINSELAESRG